MIKYLPYTKPVFIRSTIIYKTKNSINYLFSMIRQSYHSHLNNQLIFHSWTPPPPPVYSGDRSYQKLSHLGGAEWYQIFCQKGDKPEMESLCRNREVAIFRTLHFNFIYCMLCLNYKPYLLLILQSFENPCKILIQFFIVYTKTVYHLYIFDPFG